MSGVNKVSLGSWLKLADTAFDDSRQLMFDKISKSKINDLRVSAFLLHWSIELYLKAFLFDKNQGAWGHDLIKIFKNCLKIDPEINNQNLRTKELKHHQDYWIAEINRFGNEYGGFRYINESNVEFSFYVMIHEQFEEMITYIKKVTNDSKNISPMLNRSKKFDKQEREAV